MATFVYHLLSGEPRGIEIPDDQLQAHEWPTRSRMGGVPPFDPDQPLLSQVHGTELCIEACNRPDEAIGRMHVPPGVPPPYYWCEEYGSWATRTSAQPPRPETIR